MTIPVLYSRKDVLTSPLVVLAFCVVVVMLLEWEVHAAPLSTGLPFLNPSLLVAAERISNFPQARAIREYDPATGNLLQSLDLGANCTTRYSRLSLTEDGSHLMTLCTQDPVASTTLTTCAIGLINVSNPVVIDLSTNLPSSFCESGMVNDIFSPDGQVFYFRAIGSYINGPVYFIYVRTYGQSASDPMIRVGTLSQYTNSDGGLSRFNQTLYAGATSLLSTYLPDPIPTTADSFHLNVSGRFAIAEAGQDMQAFTFLNRRSNDPYANSLYFAATTSSTPKIYSIRKLYRDPGTSYWYEPQQPSVNISGYNANIFAAYVDSDNAANIFMRSDNYRAIVKTRDIGPPESGLVFSANLTFITPETGSNIMFVGATILSQPPDSPSASQTPSPTSSHTPSLSASPTSYRVRFFQSPSPSPAASPSGNRIRVAFSRSPVARA